MHLHATITVGRETDSGGYVDLTVTVEGEVSETPEEYRVAGLRVVAMAPRYVEEWSDLSPAEQASAIEALIEKYQHSGAAERCAICGAELAAGEGLRREVGVICRPGRGCAFRANNDARDWS
ncbi:MAG TPA: hypothetical protein VFP50_15500 [Anaeromyxobacteraceae bacterium]|nr:hypothetical protein [Anaeromyxobacteraceae bacterium]